MLVSVIGPADGCFVSMEWMNLGEDKYKYKDYMNKAGYGYGHTLGLTREFPTSMSYRRVNEGIWYSNELYWEHYHLKNYNPMIQIEVKI